MRAKKTDLRSYVFTEANARWKLIYHLDFHLNLPLIYLEGVQEGFYVTKELFHWRLLNVQTEKFDEFLVHCGHVFVHLNKNIDLILGAAIKTVRAVKEKNCIWPCHAFGVIKEKLKWNFPVVLFIILHKVVLPFESLDEILKCDHSNESFWAIISCGTVYYAMQGGSTFWVCGRNLEVLPFKLELLSCTFLFYWMSLYGAQNPGADLGGGCRGCAPPWDDLRFSNTTGVLQKKTMWIIGVEVEQETSAPPPKKNSGSAPWP